MENVVTHEDWKVCFSELAPGLVLFARQWVRTAADAEDIVQDAFVRFWRRNHSASKIAPCSTLRSVPSRSILSGGITGEPGAKRKLFCDAEQTAQPQFDNWMTRSAGWLAALDVCRVINARCWS